MGIFDGKGVIVTGASSGIGKAIAFRFATEGAFVALVARNEEKLRENVEKIEQVGGKAIFYTADVRDFDRAQEIVKDFHKKAGSIDVLVNNAGATRDKFLIQMKEKDFTDIIDINLKGTFNFSKAVSRIMLRQKGGVIINISSVVGITGNPGQSNYAASKAGIIAFTKSLAKELGSRNIRVVAVAPGFVETAMTSGLPEEVKDTYLQSIALRRFGTPEDIANVVNFLASPDAGYITGQVIVVDGGMI